MQNWTSSELVKESKLIAHIANFINGSLISKVLSTYSLGINTH